MGWSCARRAAWVLDAWTKVCLENSGSQNQYSRRNQGVYFWERSNKEHYDGAITGSIWKIIGKNCRLSGTFRIEGDGTVTRAPKFLRVVSPLPKELDAKELEIHIRN